MEYKGYLNIDLDEGIATFTAEDSEGCQHRMLRVTHLPKPIPVDFAIDVVAIRNITSYTPITREDIDVHDIDESEDLDYCPVCTKIHTSADYTKWGPYTFVQGHEYIIWTRTSQQTYAHRGRMQYLGRGPSNFKYQLTFNARGPDRSTGNQFGGTQMLDARNIIKLEEIDRDPAKRYVDEIDRDMPRTKTGE